MKYLVLAAMAASVVPASAFEYSGFRSGMTVVEAQAVAAQRGSMLVAQPSIAGLYTLGNAQGSTMNLTFCSDKLFAVNASIAGGVDAFASQTGELLSQMGQPAVSARSGYTESGQLSAVRMTWFPVPGEEVSVDISAFKGGTNVTRGYLAFEALCPRP